MALIPTAELVSAGPVCAFNVITLEHVAAVVAGAEQAGQPAIVQVSENAVRFHGGRLAPIAAAARAWAESSGAHLALHLDHVVTPSLWEAAPRHGFGSFMVDASRLPFAGNVAATRAAVHFGHAHGLWVEAELGTVGGKPGDPHAPDARTDPGEAASYVEQTGVDCLAVAVGSRHAMTSATAVLDHDLIAALRAAVPVPLVLHGSSGVTAADLRRATVGGIRKVNIGTALNVAYTAAVRGAVATHTDPRRYLTSARDAMAEAVAGHLINLGRPG
jgi:fructose-bisphosphate aldolase class II